MFKKNLKNCFAVPGLKKNENNTQQFYEILKHKIRWVVVDLYVYAVVNEIL